MESLARQLLPRPGCPTGLPCVARVTAGSRLLGPSLGHLQRVESSTLHVPCWSAASVGCGAGNGGTAALLAWPLGISRGCPSYQLARP